MFNKQWFFLAAFLFGAGLVLGLATPPGDSGLLPEEVAAFEEFAEFLAPLPKTTVFLAILIKNVSAILMSFILSPIFGLMPVLALTVNGWLIGLVSISVIQEESLGYLLSGLLPHGVFELPALIIGEAVALSFGTAVMLALFRRERRRSLLPRLRQHLRYLTIALLLLLPAAIIETFITPLFLG